MNLIDKNLKFTFAISFFATVLIPIFLPTFRLYFFLPFIIISFYQRSLILCLWYSVLCGLIVDILAAGDQLGLYSLMYLFTTLALFNLRQNFFSDSLTTLPIMTFFYSLTITVGELLIFWSIGRAPELSLSWIFCDLLLMPLFDAIYAFSVFILPLICFGRRRVKGSEYFTR